MIWIIDFFGGKYDDSLRKNMNLKGKWRKNGGKEEIFTVLGGKISFWKKGWGWAKISYFMEIYTPAF